jgi:uncharacterized protein (TIGR02569 family)
VVLSPAPDLARAEWSAAVRADINVEGVRLALPRSARDGRYVVSGWRADTFVEGSPEPRHDEVVALSCRLHAATVRLKQPQFLREPPAPGRWGEVEVFAAADRAAWEPEPLASARTAPALQDTAPERQRSRRLLAQLGTLRRETTSPNQVVHGDLFGTVLFAGSLAPAITDIAAYWRPAAWASGVAVVDSIAWGGADDELVSRWEDLPEWPQMLLRATMFRLAVHALHPRSTPSALPGLERVADLVRDMLQGRPPRH